MEAGLYFSAKFSESYNTIGRHETIFFFAKNLETISGIVQTWERYLNNYQLIFLEKI